jgi:hypothetical protein
MPKPPIELAEQVTEKVKVKHPNDRASRPARGSSIRHGSPRLLLATNNQGKAREYALCWKGSPSR